MFDTLTVEDQVTRAAITGSNEQRTTCPICHRSVKVKFAHLATDHVLGHMPEVFCIDCIKEYNYSIVVIK